VKYTRLVSAAIALIVQSACTDQAADAGSALGDPAGIVAPRFDVNPGYPTDEEYQALTNTAPSASVSGSFAGNFLSYTGTGTAQSSYYYNDYHVVFRVSLLNSDGNTVNTDSLSDGITLIPLLASPRTSPFSKTILTIGRACGLLGKTTIHGYSAISAWKDGFLAAYKVPITASGESAQPACPVTEQNTTVVYLCNGIYQDNETDCESEGEGGSGPGSGGGGGGPGGGEGGNNTCYMITTWDNYEEWYDWETFTTHLVFVGRGSATMPYSC
jgi:hypothetical protein